MSSYIELKQQAEDLLRQAELIRKSEIELIVADIKGKMSAYCISFEDLGGLSRPARGRKAQSPKARSGVRLAKPTTAAKLKAKSGKQRKQVAAKYRYDATGETWSGRGKPPKWLAALEASGRKREEFAVSAG